MKPICVTPQSTLLIAALAAIWSLCSTTITSAQTTWHVPGDFTTIQQAIDAASSAGGDEIIVAPGTYNEAINFNGKAVHLRSSDGPEVTIIDASGLNTSVITCESGEGPDTILEGFTITGGTGTDIGSATIGGGMRITDASPTIVDCIFTNNLADYGGAMSIIAGNPVIANTIFASNVATVRGGGLHSGNVSNPIVTGCTFGANSAQFLGGAIYTAINSAVDLSDTQFCANAANTPNNLTGPWNNFGGNVFNADCGCAGFCGAVSPWGCSCDEQCFVNGDCCDDLCFACDGACIDLLVPDHFPTIQSAIDAAFSDQTILVAPGTYNEAINFIGKSVHLRSSHGPHVTIIDAAGLNTTVVTCNSGEGPDTILEGFTITGGVASTGGGMRNIDSSPTVADCVFQGNLATFNGGGMFNNAASNPILENAIFCENAPNHIAGGWTDAEGNEFYDICPWTGPIKVHVPGNYGTIQAAIDDVPWGAEIIVAPGTYNEAIDFKGKAVHLLSSHGPEATIIDGKGLNISVVTCIAGEGPATILDGFTITGGNFWNGGGMRIVNSSPTVTNCVFLDNTADFGGGMYILDGSPTVTNCVFEGNSATGGWGDEGGGGMYNANSSPTVANCIFKNNTASFNGGAMFNVWESSPTITDSVFQSNTSGWVGGAIANWGSSPDVTNCEFLANTAHRGGAMYTNEGAPSVTDSLFTGNTATFFPGSDSDGRGGALYNDSNGSPTVTNCVFDGNAADSFGGGMYNTNNSSTSVTNSAFENNTAGLNGGAIYSIPLGNPSSGSCDGFCGGFSPDGCFCDEVCCDLGDCCSDKHEVCGGCDPAAPIASIAIENTSFCDNTSCEVVGLWIDLGGNEFCNPDPRPTILVPQDYDTIQGAILAMCEGEIVVAPGTYNEAIDFGGKAIHLRSSDGPEVTIIDATGLDTSVVSCLNSERPDTILEGFTITGGETSNGGGLRNVGSSPTVTNCVFHGNFATNNGGAIHNTSSSNPAIGDSFFCENVPHHITGNWTDVGGNDFFAACPWTRPITVHVPGNYGTIQAAIDDVPWGSEIIVAPGTYNEAINFGGKAVHLHSSDGPEVTIIDATGLGSSAVRCVNGEGPETIVEGFTLTGGNGGCSCVGSCGGFADGCWCDEACCQAQDCCANKFDVCGGCVPSDNGPVPSGPGGGMLNAGSSPTVIDCIFEDNIATNGGGMYNSASSPTVIDCVFDGNSATGAGTAGNGGGMFNTAGSSPIVINCTFVGNSASGAGSGGRGGGMFNTSGSSATVIESVFEANTATNNGGAVWSTSTGHATIGETTFCDNSLCEIGGPRTDLGGNEFCNPSGDLVVHVPKEFSSIQDAIDSVGCEAEIIVAPGTYNEAINLRGKAIHLRSSGGPQVTTISAAGLNARVVTCNGGEWLDTIVEGFTITGGSTSGGGGGMLNSGSSPAVVNCIFVNNSAGSGGGMTNLLDSSPHVTDCVFESNSTTSASTNQGGGGAMHNASGSTPTVTNCTFVNNTSAGHGGGIVNWSNANPTVTNCFFEGNASAHNGGGMHIAGNAGATVTNCTFLANSASNGGGMWFSGATFVGGVSVTNTLFENNSAQNGGGGIFSTGTSAKTVTNSVFRGNSANEGGGIRSSSAAIAIGDSVFCENDPDHIDGPFEDLGGNQFSDSCVLCPADLTGNGNVGVPDLLELLSQWGPCDDPQNCPADLTGDGSVGVPDLLELLAQWGPCPR